MFPLSLIAKLKLAAAAAVLLALLLGGLHLKHVWTEEAYNNGKADQQLVASSELVKQTQLAAQQFKAQQDIIEGYKTQVAASQQREALLVQALRDLKIQQQQASAQVAKLPDSAVKQDLEAKAGGPLEDVGTLRRIDDVYTQFPILSQRVDKLEATVVEKDTQVRGLQNQVAATEKQRDDLKDIYNRVAADDKLLRDLLNRPKRRVWCLWICKTKDHILPPAPIGLP